MTQRLANAYDRWVDKRFALAQEPKLNELEFGTIHAAITAERGRVQAAAAEATAMMDAWLQKVATAARAPKLPKLI